MKELRAYGLVLSGIICGLVWGNGCSDSSSGGAIATAMVNQITAGFGLIGTPNPITDTGTIDVDFAGTGAATTVSRSDHDHDATYAALAHNHDATYSQLGHNHDADYLQLSGGTLTGNVDFGGNEAQHLVVHNSATAPTAFSPGQLWYDSTNHRLNVYVVNQWLTVPAHLGYSNDTSTVTLGSTQTATGASVTATVPTDQMILVEFGGTLQTVAIEGGGSNADDWLGVSVDGTDFSLLPRIRQRTAVNLTTGGDSVQLDQSLSKKIRLVLASGTHTLTVVGTSILGAGTVTDAWIRVSLP